MLRRGDRELNACLEAHGTRPSALWEVVLGCWRRVFSLPPLSARKLHKSYKKATHRRIFISPSTMAKSLGTLSKSFEISDKWLWIQCKNRIPLSPPYFSLFFNRILAWDRKWGGRNDFSSNV